MVVREVVNIDLFKMWLEVGVIVCFCNWLKINLEFVIFLFLRGKSYNLFCVFILR